MKSWKKLASVLFAIVLGASLMVAPMATAFADIAYDSAIDQVFVDGDCVVDEGDLLSSGDVENLNLQALNVYHNHEVAAYFVTVKTLEGYSSAESYTRAFAEEYGLDTAAENGSVVFLLCLNENEYAIEAFGDAEKTFTKSTMDYINSDVFPYLGRTDWSGAAETFFGDVDQTLSGQKANSTSAVSYNGTYVTDDYGLFSDEQRASLEARATQLAQDYGIGVYLLVVDYMDGYENPSSAQRTNFATSFYRANNLGLGSGKDGVLLAIAVESRDYVTIAYGQGSYSFSDEGINAMENAVTEELGDNEWYGGCEAYYDSMSEQLQYYAARGEPWTEPDLFSLLLKVLATLGIPLGVAGARVGSERSAMKTAREQTEASNYLVRDSFQLTRSNDRFIRTSLIATPKPKDEDSGGGGGFGGGGWGGGGGGGFSSSGGGKF